MFPNAHVSIDGSVVGNISVTTSSFANFALSNVSARAAIHTLRVAFTNDYYSGGQDLNLYVQSITIMPNGSVPASPPDSAPSPDAFKSNGWT
jgi:Ca-dependent carbohydrate-binding module xylan-binding